MDGNRDFRSHYRTSGLDSSHSLGVESPNVVAEAHLYPCRVRRQVTVSRASPRSAFAQTAKLSSSLFPFVGFRLAYLTPEKNSDPTLTSIIPALLTQAVLHFSIIASCVTTLKPFLRHFDPTYVLESAEINTSKRSRVSTTTTNPSRDPYYRLEPVNRSNRSRGGEPNDNISWRPYQGPTQPDRHAEAYHDSKATQSSQSSKEGPLARLSRTISSSLKSGTQSKQSSATRSNNRVDSESMQTDGSDRMIIERTTEVVVQHEEPRAVRKAL